MKKVLGFLVRLLVVAIVVAMVVGVIYAHSNNLSLAEVWGKVQNGTIWAEAKDFVTKYIFVKPTPVPATTTATPTPAPVSATTTVVPTTTPVSATATVAPTSTTAPVAMSFVQVETDKALGKEYYRLNSSGTTDDLLEYLVLSGVTAEDAVTGAYCPNYGAMMSFEEDDGIISAYNLYLMHDVDVSVKFARNGAQIYAYDPCATSFDCHSGKKDGGFAGFSDRLAHTRWFCTDHAAFYISVLRAEGYPEDNPLGSFGTENGFNPEVLKAVRLVETDEDRFDWCLVYCDCKAPTTGGSSNNSGNSGNGGNTGNGSFAHEPTPTPAHNAPAHEPLPTPTANASVHEPLPTASNMNRQPTGDRERW